MKQVLGFHVQTRKYLKQEKNLINVDVNEDYRILKISEELKKDSNVIDFLKQNQNLATDARPSSFATLLQFPVVYTPA